MNQQQLKKFENATCKLHIVGESIFFTTPGKTEKDTPFRRLVGVVKHDEFVWVHKDFAIDSE